MGSPQHSLKTCCRSIPCIATLGAALIAAAHVKLQRLLQDVHVASRYLCSYEEAGTASRCNVLKTSIWLVIVHMTAQPH